MTVMENHSGRQGRPQAQVAHPGQPDAFERLPELQPACQRVPSSLRWLSRRATPPANRIGNWLVFDGDHPKPSGGGWLVAPPREAPTHPSSSR